MARFPGRPGHRYAELPKDSWLTVPLRKPYAQEGLAAAITRVNGAKARPAP